MERSGERFEQGLDSCRGFVVKRQLSQRLLANARRPGEVLGWWRYQRSRPPSEEAFLVSMPSSGTYWLRLMIGHAMVSAWDLPFKIDSIEIPDLVPSHRVKSQRFRFNDRRDIPRVQHSHRGYERAHKGRRIVLLVRDLRDALLSHWRIQVDSGRFEGSIAEFIRQPPGQRHTLDSRIDLFNDWGRAEAAGEQMHVVRFESLRAQPAETIKEVLDFIGIPADEASIDSTVAFGSRDNMAKLEESNPVRVARGRAIKVRKGAVGGFREVMATEDLQYIADRTRQRLNWTAGYDYTI